MRLPRTVLGLLPLLVSFAAFADEGMWLFNQPPARTLHERYDFDLTPGWLDHLQRASVRFSSGGSGSFVSRDGLVITNHHVGADALQKLSNADHDYIRDGFYAPTPSDELRCLDLELNVLQSIEDVTARVNAAIPKEATAEEAFESRRRAIAAIEKESLDATGLRSNVVTLWQGAAYHLYRFKRYTDVRLVFAPEFQAAFFGGDPDNFEFPRAALDVCFFRAYENGRPARIADFLHFSPTGAREGDLVFVSGHPGRTNRLRTVAELESMRDRGLPDRLDVIKRREVLFATWGARSEENARRVKEDFFGAQNGRKASEGRLAGLLDPAFFTARRESEAAFKSRLRKDPEFAGALSAYDRIADATRALDAESARRNLLEEGQAFGCESFFLARTLLRAGDERPKVNGDRLREFTDSEKASLELNLFSARPIYPDLETVKLADALTALAARLGVDDPAVQKILAGHSPRERAAQLVDDTKVRDPAFRRRLYEGGAKAVAAANDPMIELARTVDGEARSLRKNSEAQGEIKEQAQSAIDRARNALDGTNGYPDATFTLRLSFGTVKGYEEDGQTVAPITTLAFLFGRSAERKNHEPFDLPPAWAGKEKSVDPATPLNFVSTNDIIGGNSGSPVVNRDAEFVGIIFDGNRQSLPWDTAYDDRQGRAVSVHSAAILAALDHVYGAKNLVRELLDRSGLEKPFPDQPHESPPRLPSDPS